MKSLVVVTLLAAATKPPVAPSLPATVVEAPPPITVVLQPPASPRQVRAEPTQAVFDVVATAGREALWSGSMRVGMSGASYTQTLREADEPCPGQASGEDPSTRYNNESREISINVARRNGREYPDRFTVNARWTRPLATCEGIGSRGVTFDQTVDVAIGQTARIKGDAGFEIALTRRAR